MSTRTRTPASVRPLLAGLALLSAAACTDCGPDPVGPDSQIRSVRIVPDEPSLFVGETLQLSADVRDASGVSVSSAAISWSVANSTFASVSASGLLTAHNPGTTSVTASVEGVSDTQVLTVLAEAADEEILFTRSSATDGSWGLFAVQPGGGGLRQAVSRVSELPIASDWLPDGSGFVMDLALDLTYWREYDWTIHKVTDQGRFMIEIAEGRGPAVSPDGSRVAYGHTVGSLWSVELDSGAKTEILNVGIRFNVRTGWVPRMGPDAWVEGWIGFTMEDVATSMSESFLFLTRDDGSEPRTFLTKSGDGMDESGLAFSPDGAWAAFAFGADGADEDDIYVVDLAEGTPIRIPLDGRQFEPAWSPDGEKLVFASSNGGPSDLWIVHRDGSGLVRLTDTPQSERMPAWGGSGLGG